MTRPRLQLHLSTLLIVTLLAVGLVWLNVREHSSKAYYDEHLETRQIHGRHPGYNVSIARGFPWPYEETFSDGKDYYFFEWYRLVFDVLVGLTLLAVAAAAIEWLTRRMKRGEA